jgi:superfamily II DNA or RNA helicase
VSPVRIRVDNRVRVETDESFDLELLRSLCRPFLHDNPAARGDRYSADEPAQYVTYEIRTPGAHSFPRGGMGRVRAALRAHAREWEVEDARTWSHPEPTIPDHRVVLWPHQERLVSAATARQNCILTASTGSGKTTAALALIARLKRRSLVMVWTGALEKQWRERIVAELGMRPDEIGRFRGSRREIRPITVAMQQTVVSAIAAGEELADEFDVVVCDEVQRFAAPTLFASVDPFGARYRVGMSADWTRKDRKEFLTADLFGEVALSIGEAEVVRTGATVDVEVCVVPTRFAAPWYRYRQDFNRLLAQMTADPARNALVLDLAEAEVRAGEQVLVFTHRVEHARQLDAALAARGIASGVMTGGADNQEVFERTKAGLRSGEMRAAVGTYQAIAQGVDLPSVSRGICATPIANNRQQFGQVRGRLCRSHAASGKTSGRLYYMLDSAIYARRPIANFLKWRQRVQVRDGRDWVEAETYLPPAEGPRGIVGFVNPL